MPADAPKTRNAHLLIDGEPVGLDRLADAVADKVIRRLEARGILSASGIRSHRRKEDIRWCDKQSDPDASTDRTPIDESGESSWSMQKATEIIATLKQKKMRDR